MERYKFPRTKHCVWSRTIGDDDKVHATMDFFRGREVVVTEKMDGENMSIYADGYSHARSVEKNYHASRNWARSFAASVSYLIPKGWRITGEYLYAKHSIYYPDLETYFYGFGIWDDRNVALDWDTTLSYFKQWGIVPVKELYRGVYDEDKIKGLWDESKWDTMEGYVIRITDEIPYDEYSKLTAKFVRPKHVQSDEHWMHKPIEPNGLRLKI